MYHQVQSRNAVVLRSARAFFSVVTILVCGLFSAESLLADEGMWLLNRLPVEHLKAAHGFEPDQRWADHLMKSCVRFNVGGSASFVSSNGLVLTNHHVGSDTLYKLSTKENDYAKDGFLARTPDEELKAPDLELNQLLKITDVTEKVNAAVGNDLPAAEAAVVRRARIGEIESAATKETVAGSITSISTRNLPTCGWFGHRRHRSRSSVAMQTILNIHDTTSTHASFASTKMTNLPRLSITLNGQKMVPQKTS
jgi:hypothetical protein